MGRVRARHVGKAAVWGFSPTWRTYRARIATTLATLLALLALGVAAYAADAMQADAARDARERELMCQRVGASMAFWRGIRCWEAASDGAPPPMQ
jgi:hypothetical protein